VLTNERMGLLALAILWVNVLLIAAAAAKQLAALLALRAALAKAGVVRGRVVRGDGPGGALAAHRVAQVGRAAGDGGVIVFHDHEAAGEVFGGAISTAGGEEIAIPPVPPIPPAEAEVWLDAGTIARAGACGSAAAFDGAYASARKAQGFERTVIATVGQGAEVFVSARGAPRVATMDPRALLARKAALAAAFIVAELLASAACTAIALWPPRFGLVSTAGGALCLVLFLVAQPAGVWLRDAVLVPSRAFVRGRWSRPAAPGAAEAPSAV
jgi:hypothetical protein